MKLSLLLFTLALYLSGFSQQTGDGSFANCVANWKAGETKTYSITHQKTRTGEQLNAPPFRFTYQAQVFVLDSTTEGYTIKWVFQLPGEFKKMHPYLADSLPVFDGMQMIFTVSEMGTFIELLNWEEVRDAYIKQMEMSLPKNMDSALAASMIATKKMYGSRQVVEAALIKEIQLFHLPYGYQFTTAETSSTTQLPNPSGGEPLPGRQTYQLTNVDKAKDAFTLVFRLNNTDKGNRNYDVQDYTAYLFTRSTGWVRQIYYKRTVLAGKTEESESYNIDLVTGHEY